METLEFQQTGEPEEPPIGGSKSGEYLSTKQQICQIAHSLSIDKTADYLEVDLKTGLSVEESTKRLQNDGPNKVKGAEGLSIWKIIMRQISNSLTLVLTITMALSFGIKDYIEGGVIAAVICLNIVVGFVQDYKAEKQIAALYALSAPDAKVTRDGSLVVIKAEHLVVGDIVHLSSGDIIPADLRLTDSMNLSTDESLLTGESLTIRKKPNEIFTDSHLATGDRKNMAYSGSVVTSGRGTGLVVAIGMNTEVGKIADILRKQGMKKKHSNFFMRIGSKIKFNIKTILGLIGTPLSVSLSKFALLLFGLAILLTIIVFSANKWIIPEEVLIYGICVAVAVIPESLIAVLTITIAVGTKEMAKGNVIVRKLASLEAVGGVTNICSDKTGTVTQGKMIASKAWIPNQGQLEILDSSNPYDPTSGNIKLMDLSSPNVQSYNPLSKLLRSMALCNLASVFQTTSVSEKSTSEKSLETISDWKASGEPTEIALQVLAMRFEMGKRNLLAQGDLSLIAEYSFDSATKRMTTIYRHIDGSYHAFSKGATEVLQKFTTRTEDQKEEIKRMADQFADSGLRVLSIAWRTFPSDTTLKFEPSDRDQVEIDLEFLGLVGVRDPPRTESSEAVRKCQAAGIKVHMLTGDHIRTATAIAKDVGILQTNDPKAVISAFDFDNLTDDQLDQMEHLPLVVARCSPSTKVRMVEAMHRRGAFCVMTGDGVNDSPALKRANVGIAMGLNGSDVAKEAADMVLTDDNFASIVKAIEEGRRLFDNIQKFLLHLLISNISQVILLLIGLAFRDQDGNAVFPLSPLEILWVNLITSSFLALGLGLEEPQHDIMTRKPHNVKIGVFTKEIIIDKLVYGFFMGSLCLAAFTSVAYGVGRGSLGQNCNNGWNDTCGYVFRARATTYATLTFLLLITAWEVKDFRRSLFNLDPQRFPGRFSIFPSIWNNRPLFWAVTAGFIICFPIIYLPVINRTVFKHSGISWEWGVVFGCLIVYVAFVESWKAIKRFKYRLTSDIEV